MSFLNSISRSLINADFNRSLVSKCFSNLFLCYGIGIESIGNKKCKLIMDRDPTPLKSSVVVLIGNWSCLQDIFWHLYSSCCPKCFINLAPQNTKELRQALWFNQRHLGVIISNLSGGDGDLIKATTCNKFPDKTLKMFWIHSLRGNQSHLFSTLAEVIGSFKVQLLQVVICLWHWCQRKWNFLCVWASLKI